MISALLSGKWFVSGVQPPSLHSSLERTVSPRPLASGPEALHYFVYVYVSTITELLSQTVAKRTPLLKTLLRELSDSLAQVPHFTTDEAETRVLSHLPRDTLFLVASNDSRTQGRA